jgi:hypothetical protein
MYTVEFQKRGLPHAHILIWLSGQNKLTTGNDIDGIISAELPDSVRYPRLSEAVSKFMIHGPCGGPFKGSPCINSVGKCSKFYPKKFRTSTTFDQDGYPCYKRRNTGLTIQKKGAKIDNRFVVPYNPYLLVRYSGHVNVEYCNKSNSIKYLFKYVNKGPDRATLELSSAGDKSKEMDEIKQYYECRYVSPCEAVWRIFAYDIHHHWPPVTQLTFHLANEQSVLFEEYGTIGSVVSRYEEVNTMFLAWFEANVKYPEGKDLTYAEFPTRFVYNKDRKAWKPRETGYSIGRLNYTPPGVGQLYYMRILLAVQRGCTSFRDIRTVNGHVHDTYQDACDALGLLDDDKEFISLINEVGELASGQQLRRMFATLLFMNTMANPVVVWNSTCRLLAYGIIYHKRRELNIPGILFRYCVCFMHNKFFVFSVLKQ